METSSIWRGQELQKFRENSYAKFKNESSNSNEEGEIKFEAEEGEISGLINLQKTSFMNSFECKSCYASFFKLDALQDHILEHDKKNLLSCRQCKKTFSSISNLSIHIRIHTGERPYKCQECKKSFKQLGHLKRHSKTHTKDKTLERNLKYCRQCKKTFKFNSALSIHRKIHSGVKSYKCLGCAKSYSTKGNLKKHSITHTSCRQCKITFKFNSELIIHMKVHSREKPYKCLNCAKSFSHKGNLVTHNSVHTGEKPYKCQECKKSFRLKGYLKNHTPCVAGNT